MASNDARVLGYEPLIQPALLTVEVPLSETSKQTVARGRQEAASVITGEDDRLLVIVGPCSVHDPPQAIEYAKKLREKVDDWHNLVIIMRAYPEKPRTTVGWKGLINDPDLNSTYQINKGLRMVRQLYADITELGLPVAVELLDTISPQFLSDCISWGAIGARTTESQLHRELASGTSAPVGFKNGTDGSVTVAVDAMDHLECAQMGVTSTGLASVVKTAGNPHVHIILRGSSHGPNYSAEHVQKALASIDKAKAQNRGIMIDCSHGNSQKDHNRQPIVLEDVSKQLESGQKGITGVMVESFLNAGKQNIPPEGKAGLKHGVSVTDACVDWATTVTMLDQLNQSVGVRRKIGSTNGVNGVH